MIRFAASVDAHATSAGSHRPLGDLGAWHLVPNGYGRDFNSLTTRWAL